MKFFAMNCRSVVVGMACLSGLLPAAKAEVWGYVDGKGVAHFAAQKQDERYEIFFRGGESFDTAAGLQKVGTPRVVALPAAAPRLVAFFEVSRSYRQVRHHLREASRVHGVDYELLKALIATESGFDAGAVSPKGAVGLMQVMPATAERYGVAGDSRTPVEKKLADPKINIRTGTRYLSYLLGLFPGRLELALAAYNAGEGAVQRAGNRIPNYRETQNYVRTVMQLYTVLKPPSMRLDGGGNGNGKGNGNASSGGAPNRVRMELTGATSQLSGGRGYSQPVPLGGAVGRGNLPAHGYDAVPVAALGAAGASDARD